MVKEIVNAIVKVIIYIRVSTKEQLDGYSLAVQEKLCREYCERQGWSVIEVFKEAGESAKTADRTQLLKLLRYCSDNKGKIDILLVHKLDRFSRFSADHHAVRAALLKVGVKLRSVSEPIDESPAGKLMENIFAGLAQFDNDVRSERTKAGMLEKLRQGHWPWKAPLGYKNSPDGLIIDESKSEFIKKAFELYAKGVYTIRAASKVLNRMGMSTEKNKKITPQYLTKIFKNKLYIGVLAAWGEENNGVHKALITKDLFYTVEAIRLGKSIQVSIPHSSSNPIFPLKNVLKCGDCGKNLTASQSTGRKRKKYPYYHCVCGAVRLHKKVLENRFYDYLKQVQPNEDFKKLFKLLLVNVWKKKHTEAAKAVEEIDNEIFRLKELKKRLLQKNLEEVITDKDYREQTEAFDNQITTKEIERSEYRNSEASIDHIVSLAETLFKDVSSVWFEASFVNKQRFQALMFPDGLPTTNNKFGITALGLPFNLIRDFAGDETTLVTPREFESRFAG